MLGRNLSALVSWSIWAPLFLATASFQAIYGSFGLLFWYSSQSYLSLQCYGNLCRWGDESWFPASDLWSISDPCCTFVCWWSLYAHLFSKKLGFFNMVSILPFLLLKSAISLAHKWNLFSLPMGTSLLGGHWWRPRWPRWSWLLQEQSLCCSRGVLSRPKAGAFTWHTPLGLLCTRCRTSTGLQPGDFSFCYDLGWAGRAEAPARAPQPDSSRSVFSCPGAGQPPSEVILG